MAINKVEIKNFTAFEDIVINFCKGINIFVGENGTGKTHLLKLIYATVLLPKIGVPATHCLDSSQNAEMIFGPDIISRLRNKDIDACCAIFNDKTTISKMTISSGPCIPNTGTKYFNEDGGFDKIARNIVFIPAKDMLTHSKGLLEMAKKYSKDMPFDRTLLDIIEKSRQWKLDDTPDIAKKIIPVLESAIDGKIVIEDNTFFVEKANGEKTSFIHEAEGIKKFGLLWQLLMNESINKHTLLLWDEPEANINPKLIPVIVEILLELSRNGVQVFAATHDYIFAKYFEVRRSKTDSVVFHSLYKTDNGVKCETNDDFRELKNNSIIVAFDELMDEVIDGNLGD